MDDKKKGVDYEKKGVDYEKKGVVYEKKWVVYGITRWDCERVNESETKRTLKRHIVEHKQAMKKFDKKNAVAVHENTHDHHINWEEAKVVTVEQSLWRRRVQEAIRIRAQDSSMNLDCALSLSRFWDPVLPT